MAASGEQPRERATTGSALGSRLAQRGDNYGPSEWARVELAAHIRRLIDQLQATVSSDDQLSAASDLVGRAADLIANSGHDRPYQESESALAGTAAERPAAAFHSPTDPAPRITFLDNSPFSGPLNPLSLPCEVTFEADRIVAIARFGAAYEGPPGCVHGGYVAAIFDEVLGFAQSFSGQPGMTAHLGIDYRSPTPLHRDLRIVAWIDRVEGRKLFAKGTIHDGDRLCAEATGLFVSMRPEVLARLLRSRSASGE